MIDHTLRGCRTAPLAGYLKALGIFRLVAEQSGSDVTGRWRDETFVLQSDLSEQDLVDFFVDTYAPTPIVSPWNGGSGFYPSDYSDALDTLRDSDHDRFRPFRDAIAAVRSLSEMPGSLDTVDDVVTTLQEAAQGLNPGKKRSDLEALIAAVCERQPEAHTNLVRNSGLSTNTAGSVPLSELEKQAKTIKGSGKKLVGDWWKVVRKARTQCSQLARQSGKDALLPACRATLPAGSLDWLDAAIAQRADGAPAYNPVLGSGGNEGRLDFSNNFMQQVVGLFFDLEHASTESLFRAAVFSTPSRGLIKASIGQFDPGRAGGYNQGPEIETKATPINPWDFLLMLEGAVLLSSAIGRRSQAHGRNLASIPFTVAFSGVGFESSDSNEAGKAEVWLPVWPNPAGYEEVRYLFGEGRCTVGRRNASNGIDFSRALGSLGVDRGIDSFVRFAFLKRRGESYVALPAGKHPVRYRPALRLLEELDPLLDRLDAFLRGFANIPATFERARRQIDLALFACCEAPDSRRFGNLLRALGRMEAWLAQRERSKEPKLARPLEGLSLEWLRRCDDGSIEIRLAAALASIQATDKVGPIRSNLAGVDPATPWRWAESNRQKRWFGSDLSERLGNLLSQRLMDADRLSASRTPLEGSLQLHPADVVPWILGDTDSGLIEENLWGLTLVNWRRAVPKVLQNRWRRPTVQAPIPRAYALLKLLMTPRPIRDVNIRREPRIVALLQAGRLQEACDVATHRLRVSNLRPYPTRFEEGLDNRRLLAALAWPVLYQRMLESLVLQERPDQLSAQGEA